MSHHLFLVFDSEAAAQTACTLIGADLGIGSGQTSAWDTPRQRATDGKWIIQRFHPNFVNVQALPAHTQEEWDPAWFPAPDPDS